MRGERPRGSPRVSRDRGFLALAVGGCGGDDDRGAEQRAETDPAAEQSVVVELEKEEPGEGEFAGTSQAVVAPAGNKRTKIVLQLTDPPKGPPKGPLPAHLHRGKCNEAEEEAAYELEDVRNGTSTTQLDVSFSDLGKRELAIDVHSNGDVVACGNLSAGRPGTVQ